MLTHNTKTTEEPSLLDSRSYCTSPKDLCNETTLRAWFQGCLDAVYTSGFYFFQYDYVRYLFINAAGEEWLNFNKDPLYSKGEATWGKHRPDLIVRAQDFRIQRYLRHTYGLAGGEGLPSHQELRDQIVRAYVTFGQGPIPGAS